MNSQQQDVKGSLSLSFHDAASRWKDVSIKIPDCSMQDFVTSAESVAKKLSPRQNIVFPNWNRVAGSNFKVEKVEVDAAAAVRQDGLNFYSTERSDVPVKNSESEAHMSEFTKSELQAHLNANKAEVNAVASSMKKDMAEWREQMRSDLRDVTEAINKQNSTLEKHFHAQEVKLNSSLELQSSKFELALSNARLDIIKWALGLPALAFVVYKIYGLLTNSPTP